MQITLQFRVTQQINIVCIYSSSKKFLGSHFSQSHSRSLPPSPQHTPRKLSLVASNPFSMCPAILDEIQQQPSEATEIILRAVDQVLQYPADEALMDAAKETGTQLYANMVHQVKVDKINFMVMFYYYYQL